MKQTNQKARLTLIAIITIIVIITSVLFWVNAYRKGDIIGGLSGALIAAIILAFAIYIFLRGNKSLKEGYPLEDERSKRVKEKATSRAFYASLYLLLLVGLFSDTIKFRDVSQATGATVGGMAILFAAFWIYYNKKEL